MPIIFPMRGGRFMCMSKEVVRLPGLEKSEVGEKYNAETQRARRFAEKEVRRPGIWGW